MILLGHLKKYVKECILAPLFKLLEAVLELFVPLVVASLIDVGIANGDKGYILRMILVLFILALFGLAVSITAQYFSAKAAALFARDTKRALFRHIQTFSLADCDRIGLPTLINRMTGDMNQVQSGVNMTLRLLLRSPFVVFGAAIMAFTVDVKAAIIFVIVIPLMSLVGYVLLSMSVPRFRKVQGQVDQLLAQTRENYKGARVLRAFNLQDEQMESFHERNDALVRNQLKAGGISILTNPLTSFIINMGIIAVIWYGGIRVDFGSLSQGSVVALFNYMNQILVELIKLASLIQTMTRALASARRVETVFRTGSSMVDGELEGCDEECEDAIVFDHVSFKYSQDAKEETLEDITLTMPAGSTIGILGGTGSGKSSLVQLIDRLYDVDKGAVRIGGVDVRDYSLSVLRDAVGMVLQKNLLFSGSVRDNLRWGAEEASDDEIWAACGIAGAAEFLRRFPQGLDTGLGQGGVNVSGGQKQRLCIARALLKKPRILIFDDSTSAVDTATEKEIRDSLKKLEGVTKIFIAQRISSVMEAQRIFILDNGRLVDSGTHDELLRTSRIYQEIYESQIKGGSL